MNKHRNKNPTRQPASPSSEADSAAILSKVSLLTAGAITACLLWFAGPPCGLFPVAMVALCPLMMVAQSERRLSRGGWLSLHLGMTIYFLLSLQGLRHAHPAMFLCWGALSAYLAIYPILFVAICRYLSARFSLILVAPIAWVATEWVRNHLLTGISVLMLGHTQANAPAMIQVAELFGTYGVSYLLVVTNVAAWVVMKWCWNRRADRFPKAEVCGGAGLLVANLLFGFWRLSEPENPDKLATFVLLQRNEPVVYGQAIEREVEIFQNYARDAIAAVRKSNREIDAVVWPESMFSGAMHWMEATDSLVVPPQAEATEAEFRYGIQQQRQAIMSRAQTITSLMNQPQPPHLLAGCGVVVYGERARLYSGVLHVRPNSPIEEWYGKRHLVMFGEYVPILPHLPWLNQLVPPELGVTNGTSTVVMDVNGTIVSPNICIETAVERVTLSQMQDVDSTGKRPDVILTVTNDAWFDQSSVIDHHLRCVQLLAVGCRRPILSAANNGPTAWVNARGKVIESIQTGETGHILATPTRSERLSLYVRWSDWPAALVTIACGALLLWQRFRRSCSIS